MNKGLLKPFEEEERLNFTDVRRLQEDAYAIEQLLIANGAVADKDYKILDLFKLAAEWRKAILIENIGEMVQER